MSTTTLPLAPRRAALLQQEPDLRPRDVATRLGVTEAELVAIGEAVPLRPEWRDILLAVPALGDVMALTRNEAAVHEKTGTYGRVEGTGHAAIVLGEPIDLRIFFSRWKHGFAVTERSPRGVRHSLQFFDPHGAAVHKIYVTDATDRDAYQALVDRFRADPQPLAIHPQPAPKPPRPDAEIDVAGFLRDWDGLQDTHDFFPMLGRYKVGRTQALRLAGPGRARPVQAQSLRLSLTQAAERGIDIMVFVGSPGVIQIHTGPVVTVKPAGPWFNVLDPGFNLHLREDMIDTAWVVAKPTADGQVTSLELYDTQGGQIATLFGRRKPGQAEDPAWRSLADALPAATP